MHDDREHASEDHVLAPPPGAWNPAHRFSQRVMRPIERYLHVEAASGVVLLVAAAVAVAWANSFWGGAYEHLWHTPVHFGVGTLELREPLHFWINDGLMSVFFFVVGLEIRREIHEGELADPRRAALPIAGAIGGMIAPAALYLVLNPTVATRGGWGVPMATDIAFAVGTLALLGKRVPSALRVLLLTLAIIDDIGAILVIAIFYSRGIALGGLALALAGVLGVLVLQRFGVRRAVVYLPPAAIIWGGLWHAGVHPTMAGVIVGLMAPVEPWLGSHGFVQVARRAIDEFDERTERADGDTHRLVGPLQRVHRAQREALSPVARLQAELHPWVAFAIMPLFALANAGVRLDGITFDDHGVHLLLGVIAGLVVGKPGGVLLATFITVKLGLCALPRGVSWRGILVVGALAGIGFTMAIFVAGLAFRDPALLGVAKLAVLISSGAAGLAGLFIGRLALPARPDVGAAATLEEAEASTER